MIPSITIPKNEEIIMKDQGLYEHGISWKPGHLYLVRERSERIYEELPKATPKYTKLSNMELPREIPTEKPSVAEFTDKRLIFAQGTRIIFQGNLKNLVLCEIVKRKCILGKRVKQLRFVFENRNVYIATRNVEEWVDIIGQVAKGE